MCDYFHLSWLHSVVLSLEATTSTHTCLCAFCFVVLFPFSNRTLVRVGSSILKLGFSFNFHLLNDGKLTILIGNSYIFIVFLIEIEVFRCKSIGTPSTFLLPTRSYNRQRLMTTLFLPTFYRLFLNILWTLVSLTLSSSFAVPKMCFVIVFLNQVIRCWLLPRLIPEGASKSTNSLMPSTRTLDDKVHRNVSRNHLNGKGMLNDKISHFMLI